jgi:hypothetical protein
MPSNRANLKKHVLSIALRAQNALVDCIARDRFCRLHCAKLKKDLKKPPKNTPFEGQNGPKNEEKYVAEGTFWIQTSENTRSLHPNEPRNADKSTLGAVSQTPKNALVDCIARRKTKLINVRMYQISPQFNSVQL